MANPILVEVTRGPHIESVHRGALAVFDGDGRAILTVGDVATPTYPRSAVKLIQALVLVESGAADRFGFADRELALAQASHSAEPAHRNGVAAMLAAAGLDASALECGSHWPFHHAQLAELLAEGRGPDALGNNCSGKHAGFLCAAVHLGIDPVGYVQAGHPVQELVRDALEAVTATPHRGDRFGVDGCSIPTYAIGLDAMAAGFARLATGRGLGPERARAARRLFDAAMAEPFFVAGTGRACTELMAAAPGRIYAKTGAEGVFCGALPELGLGFALKIDDGATRASEVLVAALAARLLGPQDPAFGPLSGRAGRPLSNWNGTEVGAVTARLPPRA